MYNAETLPQCNNFRFFTAYGIFFVMHALFHQPATRLFFNTLPVLTSGKLGKDWTPGHCAKAFFRFRHAEISQKLTFPPQKFINQIVVFRKKEAVIGNTPCFTVHCTVITNTLFSVTGMAAQRWNHALFCCSRSLRHEDECKAGVNHYGHREHSLFGHTGGAVFFSLVQVYIPNLS